MRFPELTRLLKKQCCRRLGDAYSEAGKLIRFRKVLEEVKKQKGPSLKLLEKKLAITSPNWDVKLKEATIASVIKIAALLQLVQIKEQRVYEVGKNSAIVALPPMNERMERDYTQKELSKEEKIYFLKKILENDSVTIFALLSLIEAKSDISSENFRDYHYNFIKINKSLYSSAKHPFKKLVSNRMFDLKKNVEGPPKKSEFEIAREEYLRKRGLTKVKRKKEGPPEYSKRIEMVKGWLKDLQLVKNGDLTIYGKRLLQDNRIYSEKIYSKKIGNLTVRILLPEYDVLKQVFNEMPRKIRDKKLSEDEIAKLCANSYGYDLSSKTYSFEDFYNFVKQGFDILRDKTYFQANLDAIKEYVEIKSVCEKNYFPKFDLYISKLQKLSGVTLLRSQRGRGYLVIRNGL